eukprot:2817058-Rhodomonas_salina.1
MCALGADIVGWNGEGRGAWHWRGGGTLFRRASLPLGALEGRELWQPGMLLGGAAGCVDSALHADHMRSGAGVWPELAGDVHGAVEAGGRSVSASAELSGGQAGKWGDRPMAGFQRMALLQGTGINLDGVAIGE